MRLLSQKLHPSRTWSKGFTLTEMLVTTFILVLASTLMATGIPAAIDTYQKVVKTSNAQLALSTTISVLQSELGTATDVKVVGDKAYYYSSSEGCWASVGNDTREGATCRGLVKQYLLGMPTPTTPVAELGADGDPVPLVSNEAITTALKVEFATGGVTRPSGKNEVDVHIIVKDAAEHTLASVGDTTGGGIPYRILTRFAQEE